MIDNLPFWIEILFIITCCLTILLFYHANGKSKKLLYLVVGWSIIQSVLALTGFYQNTDAFPPRFAFVLIPSILLIIYGLTGNRINWIIENRNTKISTLLHTVRILVEIVLLQLYLHKYVPKLMTFEGRNFDILIGISAPIIFYLLLKNNISKKALLVWNIIGLLFVLFILINGVLSSKLPFQQFAFNQPNIAVNYFPFVLLPATVVPIVIYTHLSDILKLWKEIKV